MICAGIDAGSRKIKAVLMDCRSFDIIAADAADQGIEQENLAIALFEQLLKRSRIGRKDVRYIVATGYGRNAIRFAERTVTEITCHAVGVRHLIPQARSIIDIGGQDSKFIHLNSSGGVEDFAMNDRCAAGTGCFLEMVAKKLEVPIGSMGNLAAQSRKPAIISSTCAVFAETEIIGLLSDHTTAADIAAGVQASIASRVLSMAGRNVHSPVVFTGGVAMIDGMEKALASAIGKPIVTSPQPQMTGAIGAAILAARGLTS